MIDEPSPTPQQRSSDVASLRAALAAQEQELALLRSRLAELERASDAPDAEPRTTRRRLLTLAGGAAAVAVGATASMVRPAAAANGSAVTLAGTTQITPGAAFTTYLDYTVATSGQANYFLVADVGTYASQDSARVPAADLRAAISGLVGTTTSRTRSGVAGVSEVQDGTGVVGVAWNGSSAFGVWGDSAAGRGVYGSSTTGSGVTGTSTSGYAMYAGGNGRIGMSSFLAAGPPTTGTFALHDIVGDQQGDIWACIAAGTPGTWRKITAEPATTPPPTTTAVSFHPLAPARVYDSRVENNGAGPLISPVTRTISVADARDLKTGAVTVPNFVPAGAVAVTCNVTVVNTQGVGGFLTLNPGGITTVSASTINWFGPNQILNNGVTLAVDANRLLTAVVGPNPTDFVIDVTGYFL